jgi:predicted transcriptional regulator
MLVNLLTLTVVNGTKWEAGKVMTTYTSGAAGFAAAIMTALSNGNAIRCAREGLRVSQTSLAREAGISQSYLAKVESGERQMTDEMTHRVWEALARLDENYQRPITIRLEGEHPIATGTEQL